MTACPSRTGSHQGFTLLELLIVLLMMTLALSVVGVNFSQRSDSTRLQASATELMSALRYARGQALGSQQEVTLNLDLASNSYRISSRGKKRFLGKNIAITMTTAQREIDSSQQGKIRFFPDGSSTGGRIILQQDKLKWQLDINWLTGHVEIAAG